MTEVLLEAGQRNLNRLEYIVTGLKHINLIESCYIHSPDIQE